ncbi:MAG: TolC family protein [Arcobacteraceae bacterium]
MADSAYYPSVDVQSIYGYTKGGAVKHSMPNASYRHYTNSLQITQNLFNGFSTTYTIDYQKNRILAAAYHYVERANDMAFQTVGAYLDVIRAYKLLQNAQDSANITEQIYNDVLELNKSGFNSNSEVTKIDAALSLAKSNLIVSQNNAVDKEFRFQRLFGRSANVNEFEMPKIDIPMPESKERAVMVAMTNNPSILVSNYNVQGAQALYKESKSGFYPRIDLQLEQMLDDPHHNNPYETGDDRFRASVVLNWNLYQGGADKARMDKSKSTIHQEVEIQRDLKRQVIEGLSLSWSAYEKLGNQLQQLNRYYEHSKKTLESYKQEYEMGRRTLLDLLSAQNDLINARAQIINAEFDKLFAQYRILDAMGMLVTTVAESTSAYAKYQDVYTKPFDIQVDTLPVKLDVDGDNVVDSLDICDNSINNNDIKPFGCSQQEKDTDKDGVPDAIDRCKNTRFGDTVDEKGCSLPNAQNKFESSPASFFTKIAPTTANTPKKEDSKGLYDYEYSTNPDKNIQSTELDNKLMYGNFEKIVRYNQIDMSGYDKKISKKDFDYIKTIAEDIKAQLKDNSVVTVIGHTKATTNKANGAKDSMDYALYVKKHLMNNGVEESLIKVESRIDTDRAFTETSSSAALLNDRVMVTLYVPKKIVLDSDFDGVIDELDKCPNTPQGHKVDKDGCSVQVELKVFFDYDSHKIREESYGDIEKFANFLKEQAVYDTVIVGHASKESELSNPIYNKNLSLRRAQSVKDALVKYGIEEKRVSADGKGFDEPIASNDTEEGRAKNRRIEANLIDTSVGGKNKMQEVNDWILGR